jgi:S-adenosylmethionine decarboxylase proenzyme
MYPLGKHILVDLYGCPASLLDDVDYIAASLTQAAQEAGATIINAEFHRFSPHGVTGVLTIKESHLAIHTWPEHGFAAVDLFTCGTRIDPWKAYEILKAALCSQRDTTTEISRGLKDGVEMRDEKQGRLE